LPRTFSSSSTITSPSLKRETVDLPSWMFRFFATRCASRGLAFPVNSIRLSKAIVSLSRHQTGQGRKDSNPRMPESKSGALGQLGDSPTESSLLAQGMVLEPLRDESRHRGRQLVEHAPRRFHAFVGREHRASRSRHARRSEEHTSELQSQSNLVCRLLL